MKYIQRLLGRADELPEAFDDIDQREFEDAIAPEKPQLAAVKAADVLARSLRGLDAERVLLETEINDRLERLRSVNVTLNALQAAQNMLTEDAAHEGERMPQIVGNVP